MSIPFVILFFLTKLISAQTASYRIYPEVYISDPGITSPFLINDTTEVITVLTKKGEYGLVPVTMEDGKPLLYSYKVGTLMGKDKQLHVDAGDFPALLRTGLHMDEEIDNKVMITGIPVNVINCTGRPNAYSISGFMAEDEDLLSILKADNQTVKKLGLTHPDMAKPLFHIWNLILTETELGNWTRFYDNLKQIYYNGSWLNFKASSSKGWQISIFFDEIHGRYNIHIDRTLTKSEEKFLDDKYSHLQPEKLSDLKRILTNLDFSEILPYYIMRYGFYEGHTSYRCDPIAISLIFGLIKIEEIDAKTDGNLYKVLTAHFISNRAEN